jgi:hypothetical protein
MRIAFSAVLQRFDKQGEKTGWTFIAVPGKTAEKIKPGTRRSYKVRGKIDSHHVKGLSMMPVGGGDFIIPINAAIRKAIKKQKGANVGLELEEDTAEYKINKELLACMEDEPLALEHFNSLLPSHQRYYSKWIETAKTDPTRTKRIAMTVNAMLLKIDFGEMLRMERDK